VNVRSLKSADLVPVMARPSTLSLRLLGPFSALVHGEPLPRTRSRREPWLLALLALHSGAPLERSWLAGVLWPDALGELSLYNLRRSLHGLREALGPEADRLLAPTPRTLRLDLTGADCDVAAFDAAVRRGDAASLKEAAALYSGPLLLGCLEEWVLPEREARERAVLGVLESLAGSARERGDLADAAAQFGRALEIDALRETALRGWMETVSAQGRHAAVSEAYRSFRLRLRDELNADPDPETVALHRRLQREARQSASPKTPPPETAPTRPEAAHLPVPLTALIGRGRETEAVAAALDDARLVTLTGTGGVGKTRLALAVAHKLAAEFPDGARFADLSPLADPKLMVQAVLTALGAWEAPGRSPSEALAEFLRPKRLLLVLDNCEHLVSASAHLSRALLEQCPGLHLLATSREPLGVAGEVQWRVPSLSLPGDATMGTADSEAVRLFVARARQVRPGWTPSEPEYAAVADIVRRLDGLPLAIEMAAARTRALPVAQIAARLGDAFRLLSGPGGGPVPRQQTLRAMLDWSWDLLDTREKALLARLSVFAGGWTLEAAETVCSGDGIEDFEVLDLLASLIDKSLVVYEETADGEGRYRLLETVRQYGRERRTEADDTATLGGRHAAYCLALAVQSDKGLRRAEQARWLTRLAAEYDNMWAALAWYEGQPDGVEGGLRLGSALWRFWTVRGDYSEGRQWMARALARDTGQVAPVAQANGLLIAGNLAYAQGDIAAARELYESALAIRRGLGDPKGIAISVSNLGLLDYVQGDLALARARFEEGLAIRRQIDDQANIADSLINLGNVAHLQGDMAAAKALFEESLAVSRSGGDQRAVAAALGNLGVVALVQGDLAAARALDEESLAIRRQLGDQSGIAESLINLGAIAFAQADLDAAQTALEESLAIARRLGDQNNVAFSLTSLGGLAHARGDDAAAAPLFHEALALRRQSVDRLGIADTLAGHGDVAEGLGRPRRAVCMWAASQAMRDSIGTPLDPAKQKTLDAQIASARAALGGKAFAAAWAEGWAMDWEQATEYALAEEAP
jgi:predicted ATPase/DNA-binding SARP family transcriptional activator